MLTRRLVTLTVLAMLAATAAAQEAMRDLISPRFGEQSLRIRYQAQTYFNEGTDAGDTKLHLMLHEFRLSFPVYQDERNEVLMHAHVDALDIDSDARIRFGPLKLQRFQLPGELYDVKVGGTYRHRFENDWIAGATVMIGSPSDRPFSSADVWDVNATGFLRVPHLDTTAWLFYLNYSINREFLSGAPIPGVAYEYSPGQDFYLLGGIPFSMLRWNATDKLSFEAAYFVPRQIKAEVGYRILQPLKLYAGYYWDNHRFFRADRHDEDERLFYYEQRAMAGVRWDLSQNWWLDAGAGYAFERYFFEAERWSDRNDARLNIDDGPVARLQIGVRF